MDDPAQHSSAYDLAVLTTYALQNPVFREIVGTRRKVIPAGNDHGWFGPTNLNRLIGSYPGAFGVKPGWTGDAGYTLVAAAERGGRSLLAVVLGSRNAFHRRRTPPELRLCHPGRVAVEAGGKFPSSGSLLRGRASEGTRVPVPAPYGPPAVAGGTALSADS